MRRFVSSLFLMMVVVVATGCGVYRPAERSLSYLWLSPNAEAQLGDQFAEELAQEFTLVDDADAQAWVREMGMRLVEHSPRTSQEFSFAITTAPDVNAFAIPGGYCYVNLGLLLYAENEAQVAAVMGHEVNHVTMRHGITRMQRSMGIQVTTMLAAALVRSPAAQAGAVIGGQGANLVAGRQFSQSDELEADKLGTIAMYEAGWDPRQSAAFFQRLYDLQEGRQPSWLESFLSTHPATQRRIDRINDLVATMDVESAPLTVNTDRFVAIQQRLRAQYSQ